MPVLISIDSKGYGKIYKTVMRNRDLPLLAKTIYAYLCAYAGCGDTAFPKREKILRDLQINKDTFTKHLAQLVKDGYITKQRTASGNLYTVMQSVPSLSEAASSEKQHTDFLVFESVAAHGFGTVPKVVMLDPDLTPQAKAIYAYFASFSGAGTTAFPRRTTIMRELLIGSMGTYYQHFNLLVDRGYITVEQKKSNGRFDICIYRLPSLVPPAGQVESAMSEKLEHGGKMLRTSAGTSEKALSEKPVSEKSELQKTRQANNIKNIVTRNSYFITEQEYNHQERPSALEVPVPTGRFTQKDVMELIRFSDLQREADSWLELMKNVLGQINTPEEECSYRKKMDDILLELSEQLTNMLNRTASPKQLIEKIQGPEFEFFFDERLSRWNEIRNVHSYIKASLENF